MKRQSRWIMLILVAVSLPLIFSESALAKEKFGVAFLGDLTGPLGFWNAPRLVGIQDSMEYINQTQDGIAGREVYLDWVDSQSKIDMATSGYERLKAKGYVVWHTCGTGEQQMLKARYEDDRSQVLYTCSASPGVMYPPGYVFGTDTYFPDKWGLFVDWLVQNWDFKKMGRTPRIAILTYPSGLGKAILADEFLNYAKEKGVEIVETVFIPFVTVDAATPLMKAKKAGADWCIGMPSATFTSLSPVCPERDSDSCWRISVRGQEIRSKCSRCPACPISRTAWCQLIKSARWKSAIYSGGNR